MTLIIEKSPTIAQAMTLAAQMTDAHMLTFTALLNEGGAVEVSPGTGVGTWHEFDHAPSAEQVFQKLGEVIELERILAVEF